jgi:RNA polymerase sigma-B factor
MSPATRSATNSERSTASLAPSNAPSLHALVPSLTPREREVVRLRFEEDLTQAAIGERIGMSQMQVSRVLRQAIARLRTLALAEA